MTIGIDELPATDADIPQAFTALARIAHPSPEHASHMAATMESLYRIYMAQGMMLLDAYEKVLLHLIKRKEPS